MPSPRPQDPPGEDTAAFATSLRLVLMRAARRLRSQRADSTLTMTQLSALATVFKSGPMRAGDVASIERVQPPSMTKVLNSMASLGLISRQAHDADRRQSMVAITDAGRALLEDELRARDEWLAARLTQLSAAEISALSAVIPVLERLASE
jgi:DNA-binding MarR family transcriptional regulator